MSPASVASVSRESWRDWLWEMTVAPVNMAVPPEAPDAGVASGSRRQQSARIDAVNGNIRAIRGIGGGNELRAVFLAGLRDAAGELNQRFLPGNSFEDFADALRRRRVSGPY